MEKSDRLKKTHDWYGKNDSKIFFERYTNQADFVEKYYNTNGTKEVSGVYLISFNNIPIAVGESRQLGVRFIEHMKRLKENGEEYWGINPLEVEKGNVKLTIDILEDNILEETDRRKKEEEKINELQPILQKKYDKYYPYDKGEKKNGAWVKRKDIRIDQYIRKSKRKERVSEALKL